MANPNEVEKKLSESMTALQRLSSEHLLSTEQSFLSQKRYLQSKKKLDDVVNKQIGIITHSFQDLVTSNSKINLSRQRLTSDIFSGLKETTNSIKSQRDFVKSSLTADKKSFVSIDRLIGNISSQSDNRKDKTDDFLRQSENPLETQVELLKSINSKIGSLTGGGKGGGLFDFLINGLPKILSSLGSIALGGGEVALGAGAGALLGKYSKWFNVKSWLSPSKIVKSVGNKLGGKYIAKIKDIVESIGPRGLETAGEEGGLIAKAAKGLLSHAKSPKALLLGAGMAGLGVGGLAASEYPEKRETGGPVKANTPYIVGEKGQELFVPKQSGTIVPNKDLNGSMKSVLAEQNTVMTAGFTTVIRSLVKPLTKSMKGFSKGIADKNKGFVNIFSEGMNFIRTGISKIWNKVMGLIPGSDASQAPQAPARPQTSSTISNNTSAPTTATKTGSMVPTSVPQNYHGEFKVPKTGVRKLHDGEMVVPAFESEMIRAASELKNNYSIKRQSSSPVTMKLDEAFWMTKFVPAFAKAIKVDKKVTSGSAIRNAANPFG